MDAITAPPAPTPSFTAPLSYICNPPYLEQLKSKFAANTGTLEIQDTKYSRSEVRSLTIHLVVPIATFPKTSGRNTFNIAKIATICVPPAIKTGTSSAAPATNPANAAIIGSPTTETALKGSSLKSPGLIPAAANPSLTTPTFNSCGFSGILLLTLPSASTPIASNTPNAVVVPPGMLSPTTK